MYTSVIFDMDGTLLDTVRDLAEATNRVLERNGYMALPEKDFKHYLGDGVENLMRRVLKSQPEDKRPGDLDIESMLPNMIKAQKNEYASLWKMNTRPYDGILEMLTDLKRNGCKLGIVTNKPHDFAQLMTNYYFGSDLFDIVIGQEPDRPVKPAPDSLYYAMDSLNVSKSGLLYVGDTNTDMFTAKNADVMSIGVLWGFRSREELLESGARFIAETPDDILRIYEGHQE